MHAIIPAGGVGSRLWPLSRANRPKFLVDVRGCGSTLLQETVSRLQGLSHEITVVCGKMHEGAVREQVPSVHVISEPCPRGTMSAIGLAAALVEKEKPTEIIGSFAADHYIGDEQSFSAAVKTACAVARQGYVVTIGITPDSPSPAYGYIRQGEELTVEGHALGHNEGFTPAFSVDEFVEKPSLQRAREYLATGTYAWNAGIFISEAGVLMDALASFHPEYCEKLRRIAEDYSRSGWTDSLIEKWSGVDNAVIDRAVAEPLAREGKVAVVPASMGWSDVGDYASLQNVRNQKSEIKEDCKATVTADSSVISIKSEGASVFSHDKEVVLLGIPDAVIVETKDVIFVTTKQYSQEVGSVVDHLKKIGRTDLL